MEQKTSKMQVQPKSSDNMTGDLSTQKNAEITEKEPNENLLVQETMQNFDELPYSLRKNSEDSHAEARINMAQIEEGKEDSPALLSLAGGSEKIYLPSKKTVKKTARCWNVNPWQSKASKDKFDEICSFVDNNQSTQLIKSQSQGENEPSSITCHKACGKYSKINPFKVSLDAGSTRFKETISKNSLATFDQDGHKEVDSVKPLPNSDESTISLRKPSFKQIDEHYSTTSDKSKRVKNELKVQQKHVDFQNKVYPDPKGNWRDKVFINSPHNFEICGSYYSISYSENLNNFFPSHDIIPLCATCFLKLPDSNEIEVEIEKSKGLTIFLSQTFPRKVKTCTIHDTSGDDITQGHAYAQILRISSAVEKEIIFKGFELKEKHLKRFLAAFRHVETVELTMCHLLVSRVPDLSLALKGSKIRVLKFDYTVFRSNNFRWSDPLSLKNFIDGLATSPDLKQNLQEFHIGDRRFEELGLLDIFEETITKIFADSLGKRIALKFIQNEFKLSFDVSDLF
ncbi:unnamed protein product [Moneuplotes crassus]|uniref:Uncharacterized protein n=1 Tax=Euplotes crassus TaxID=5936 RepID=A0AAD1YA66_EUPCR|nr:unnamed protein product [Moneuplotes crassus]